MHVRFPAALLASTAALALAIPAVAEPFFNRTAAFPVVLGNGKRLFDDRSRPHAWTMVETHHSTTGVVVSTYRLGGEVPTGSFAEVEPSEAELVRRARWAREG